MYICCCLWSAHPQSGYVSGCLCTSHPASGKPRQASNPPLLIPSVLIQRTQTVPQVWSFQSGHKFEHRSQAAV